MALSLALSSCGGDDPPDETMPSSATPLTVGAVKRCIERRIQPNSIEVFDAGEGSYSLYVPAIGFKGSRGNGGVFVTKRPVLTHLLVRGLEFESWVTEDEEALVSVTHRALVEDVEACLGRKIVKVKPSHQTDDGLVTRPVVDGVEVTQVAVTAKDWADYLIEGDQEAFLTQCAQFAKSKSAADREEFYEVAEEGWYGSNDGGAMLAENMRLDGVQLKQVFIEMSKQCV